jgi:HEAT repeat protein
VIEDAAPAERDILARGLQALNSPGIVPDLILFLKRNANDGAVAVQVRDALARVVAPEDIMRIGEAVPSSPEEELLRAYLIEALAQIRNPSSVFALADLCTQTKDSDISDACAMALGSIGTPDAVASLVGLICDRGLEDLDQPLAQALMSAANKDARLFLEDVFLYSTNGVARYATAFALATLSNQESQTH